MELSTFALIGLIQQTRHLAGAVCDEKAPRWATNEVLYVCHLLEGHLHDTTHNPPSRILLAIDDDWISFDDLEDAADALSRRNSLDPSRTEKQDCGTRNGDS